MTTKKTKLSCPECNMKFDFAKGMASHRRAKHGVTGTSPTMVYQRKREAAQTLPEPVPLEEATGHKCPECGEVFEYKTSLGLHRRNKHGVQGQAPGSIHAREKRDAYLANYRRDRDGRVICPECSSPQKDAGIAMHRKQAHGLSMEEQVRIFENTPKFATETAADDPAASDPAQCQQCDFKAINAHGLRKHMSAKHSLSTTPRAIYKRELRKKTIGHPTQAIAITQTNGNIHTTEEVHPAAGGYTIPEGTLALALGRFQGLCQSISTEFDLPPRMFATRLAELIYHTQVR